MKEILTSCVGKTIKTIIDNDNGSFCFLFEGGGILEIKGNGGESWWEVNGEYKKENEIVDSVVSKGGW